LDDEVDDGCDGNAMERDSFALTSDSCSIDGFSEVNG
jgi:hypothetical protein